MFRSSFEIPQEKILPARCILKELSTNISPLKVSSWSRCSRTCGHGHQIRRVFCSKSDNKPLNETACAGRAKPLSLRRCSATNCSLKKGIISLQNWLLSVSLSLCMCIQLMITFLCRLFYALSEKYKSFSINVTSYVSGYLFLTIPRLDR